MKIGISCYPTYGGSGVVASELAMALADGGDEVHVLSYALPPRLQPIPKRLLFHLVEVREYPLFEYPPYSLALATKMVEVARRHRLDLMHVHYAVPNAVSAVLARQMLAPEPLPVVTTLHGTDVTLVGDDPSYLETTRFGIRQSDAVTTVSEALRRLTVDRLGVTTPIEVIPNFVDPRRVVPPQRRGERFRHPGKHLLVHISNFRPVKRLDDVVEVFERVRRRLPARLVLVGDGPERSGLEERCRESAAAADILFLGTVDDVEEVLWESDLFLLPSASESFGLAALEALACRVPVIATDTGGLPEVVRDGVDGYLCRVGDVEGMAAAALRLLEDEPLRQRFGASGRERALSTFGQRSIVAAYREVYGRVLTVGTTA